MQQATSSQGVSDSIAETSGSADQAASLRALELKQQLQDQRDQLTRNQLKKQRKKLSKLFNKVGTQHEVLLSMAAPSLSQHAPGSLG